MYVSLRRYFFDQSDNTFSEMLIERLRLSVESSFMLIMAILQDLDQDLTMLVCSNQDQKYFK